MKHSMISVCTGLALGICASIARTEPVDDTLVINGDIEITVQTSAQPALAEAGIDTVRSGWLYRSDETRDMERDDFDNPGISNVETARTVWATTDGTEGKACADCHKEPETMGGVRTKMPKYNGEAGDLWSLENYINDCRTKRMGAKEWGWDSNEMVDMTALISYVSRGMPMDVAIDGDAKPYWEKGKEIYYTRYGQLEFACANCHEANNGKMIRADHLSQGQINGFPTYRLKNAALNSIHNRFKGCIRDTRAETFDVGSPEFRALELYVASRGNGLSVEGPSVRN